MSQHELTEMQNLENITQKGVIKRLAKYLTKHTVSCEVGTVEDRSL